MGQDGRDMLQEILEDLFLFEDSCNVYVIRSGETAVLVDFGSGAVLQHMDSIGVTRVTDVLITHHHRDQCAGLALAAKANINIWVPHTEQDLFHSVNAHWQSREIYNNYNMRQDRFSLLYEVPATGTLMDYETREFGGRQLTVIPTPGHTIGSVTLWLELDGVQVAFTGDLIAAEGKVWSLSATQWTYNGGEGIVASILSLLDLKDRQPDLLLPSHGHRIDNPAAAIDPLVSRFWQLLQLRRHNLNLFDLIEKPYEAITPHLLMHRMSVANCYVLRSESGKALFIDFGYDFVSDLPSGSDRASRRPWLYSIPALKAQFGIEKIDVVVPTHFHDDHVAGINLLRQTEGAQVWAADLFADILERPAHYDLPCLWYDPIPVDRQLPLEQSIRWEEYELTLYALPGHARYAVAIAFEVDGLRVLATGDQYQEDDGLELNYVYANRFQRNDFIKSAALYRRLQPDLIVTGHWEPLWVKEDYFDQIASRGAELAQLHRDLLTSALNDEGFLARITPYQAIIQDGESSLFTVEICNPFANPVTATLRPVVPAGWKVSDTAVNLTLAAHATSAVAFTVMPPADFTGNRARIGVDVTLNGQPYGQQAVALLTTR